MDLHKILKYVAYALGVIGAIFALLIMTGSDGMIDNILYVTYVVLFIVIALILIYVVKGIFAGNIKKTLMTVGLFLAVILISYLISSGTDLDLKQFNDKGLGITEGVSKNVGAGLYAFYLLSVIAIGATLLSTIKKIFNK
jgi:NADH:ubiquinone oxidoreductase subunit 6 (subunit J)